MACMSVMWACCITYGQPLAVMLLQLPMGHTHCQDAYSGGLKGHLLECQAFFATGLTSDVQKAAGEAISAARDNIAEEFSQKFVKATIDPYAGARRWH